MPIVGLADGRAGPFAFERPISAPVVKEAGAMADDVIEVRVKRISYGSGPHRAAMGLLRRIAAEAQSSGTFNALTDGAVPYAEINGLFRK